MTQSVILTSPHEVATYRTLICENFEKSRQHLASLCASEDGFSLFQQLKFKKRWWNLCRVNLNIC